MSLWNGIYAPLVISLYSYFYDGHEKLVDMTQLIVDLVLLILISSAAINCVGGSSYDVTSIDGSDDYAATMRRLTDNAVSKSPILESNARYLQSSKWADDYDPSKSKKHNDMINLGAIFGELRSAVEARLTVPISSLAVSVPAITSLNASTISAALETVGLQDLQLRQERINAASAALGTAEAKLQASDAPEDPNVLVLEYHSSALVSSFFPSFSFSSGFGTPHARTVDETAGATAFKAHIFSNDEACSRALRSSALVLPRRLRRASFGNQIDVVMVVGQDLVGGAVKEKVVEAFEWWSKRRGGWPKPIVFEEQETGFAAARGRR
ncbi:uncharacterized protein KY384_002172 [Bacidia gigantensis]|uniref:uncharacterized protein n=1 Tax=Bacidia gigantensis TaxID=2732470 RepID=UPI001D055EBA|nr:uncharacterized protein KY384_002172 [Bacidia gigantensis]KAG8533389.1 hypothetical protein KY384_002172 [Bacidia gigantensis]